MSSFRAAPGADLGGQDSGQEGGSVAEDHHPTKGGSLASGSLHGCVPFSTSAVRGATAVDLPPRWAQLPSAAASLTFGVVFLAISTVGEIAQQSLGHVGFLVVTLLGGVVSSASSVVAAATLAGQGKVQPAVAAYAVVLASMTTLLSNVPAVQIAGQNWPRSIRIALLSGAIVLAGLIGLLIELALQGHAWPV
jgi:hypothetical protein